jgi:hypothetical protein
VTAEVAEEMTELIQAIAEELGEVAELMDEIGDSILDFVVNRMKVTVIRFLNWASLHGLCVRCEMRDSRWIGDQAQIARGKSVKRNVDDSGCHEDGSWKPAKL